MDPVLERLKVIESTVCRNLFKEILEADLVTALLEVVKAFS